MKTTNQKQYDDWKAKNTDAYGSGIFHYAEAWANLMEERIDSGEDIADMAKETSHISDTEGITGFMYGAAVVILAKCWVYGEQLRRWHNLDVQIQHEGEEANKEGTVLNPAILNIGPKEK